MPINTKRYLHPVCALTLLAVLATSWSDTVFAQNTYTSLRNRLNASLSLAKSQNEDFMRQIWFKDMESRLGRWVKRDDELKEILNAVYDYAEFYALKPELILSVMQIESAFDRFAVSRVGARGLMQIMPFWQKEIGIPDHNLLETDVNVRYGCVILKHYLEWEKGDYIKALARYNGSVGRTVYSEKVLRAWQKNWFVNYE